MTEEPPTEQRRSIMNLAQRFGPGTAVIARHMAEKYGPDAPGAHRRVIQQVIRGR